MNRAVKILKAPFLRNSATVQSLMGDMLTVMPFIYTMPIFFYGFRVLKNLIISLAVCYLLDQGCLYLKDKKFNWGDLSSLVTGAILPLLMPASVEWYIVALCAAFAILVVKHPFGGLGNTPFNCAAAAYCLAAISWTDKLSAYTKPMQWLPIFGAVGEDMRIYETTAQSLKNGGRPLADIFDVLTGNIPGAMGTTCVFIIVAAAAYLIFRRSISIGITLGTILSAGIFALIFPRISTGILDSVWFELTSGSLLFGAVFMATEPSSSPKHPYAKWIYGALIGIATMLFRHFGKMEMAFPFALLIVNSLTPFLDKIGTGIDRYTDIPSIFPSIKLKKAEKGGTENE